MAGPWDKYSSGGGGAIIAPSNPYASASEERARAAEERAKRAEARANAAEQRAADSDARKNKTTDARGGVETTEGERNAAFLAARVAGGVQKLSELDNGAPTLLEGTVGNTKPGNYVISENRQRVRDAQLDILDAALTLGTGAAYNQEQLEAYWQSYFPQPGDRAGTVADKQQRLKVLLDAARLKAGAAGGTIDRALTSAYFKPPQEQDGPKQSGSPFSPDQQRIYDAFMASNPRATADDLRSFAKAAGLPNIENADAIVAARNAGGGVRSASSARYADSLAGQTMSGVNEGVANTLGAPVDLVTAGLNLIPQGVNAVANTNLGTIEQPFMGSQWWQDRLTNIGSIFPETSDPTNLFARRVGQSVGASAVPIAGTATTLGRAGAGALSALGGGIGGATAGRLFPNNPAAEMGGELLGGGLTGIGFFGAARRNTRRAAESAVPSIPDLKNQASNLYSQAESRGIVGGPNVTANIAGRIGDIARRAEVIDSPMYPYAGEALRTTGKYAGQTINPTQIQVVREGLADAVNSTEGRQRKIARDMLQAFDEETVPLAPELANARDVASRYLQAGQVQRAIDLAEPRAAQYSVSGSANALKSEFRALDKKLINGDLNLNPAAADAVRDVSRGTTLTNGLERLGKFAPTGVVSAGFGGGVPFLIGNAVGGPMLGAGLSAGTLGAGTVGRMFANRAVSQNARRAEMLARNGGVLKVPGVSDDDLLRQTLAQIAAMEAPYAGR